MISGHIARSPRLLGKASLFFAAAFLAAPALAQEEGSYTPMTPTEGVGMPTPGGIGFQDQYSPIGEYALKIHNYALMPIITITPNTGGTNSEASSVGVAKSALARLGKAAKAEKPQSTETMV